MKVIFIHGYDTNPLKRKYQIIKQGLADMGVDCAIPAMPGGLRPRAEEWIAAVRKEIDNGSGGIILVGHRAWGRPQSCCILTSILRKILMRLSFSLRWMWL